MNRKTLSILLVFVMIASLFSPAFAKANPEAEKAWLESLGYENVVFIDKIEDLDFGQEYLAPLPEGANIIVIKGGNGPVSLKAIEITEDMIVEIDGIKYVLVNSVDLENSGGEQPDISHISFFKVDVYFTLEKEWLDVDGELITEGIEALNSTLVFDPDFVLGKNYVPYFFDEYEIDETEWAEGFAPVVGKVYVEPFGTGTFINQEEPTEIYSVISGIKYDADQEELGLWFSDVSFDFEIRDSEGELIATAYSSMLDGVLMFKFVGDDEFENSLELEPGDYTITELPKDGYLPVKYKMISGINEVEVFSDEELSIAFTADGESLISFEFYNRIAPPTYRYETAYAYNGDFRGGTLNSIRGQRNWGWYIDSRDALGNVFVIYAGAGGNDITKGTPVGTVMFVIEDGQYKPIITLNDGVILEEEHFGSYKKTADIPRGVGQFKNTLLDGENGILILHLVVGIPE